MPESLKEIVEVLGAGGVRPQQAINTSKQEKSWME
jgi:hypothetical protein